MSNSNLSETKSNFNNHRRHRSNNQSHLDKTQPTSQITLQSPMGNFDDNIDEVANEQMVSFDHVMS